MKGEQIFGSVLIGLAIYLWVKLVNFFERDMQGGRSRKGLWFK